MLWKINIIGLVFTVTSKGTKHIYHSTFTRLPNKSINKFLPWSILIKNSTS